MMCDVFIGSHDDRPSRFEYVFRTLEKVKLVSYHTRQPGCIIKSKSHSVHRINDCCWGREVSERTE